MQTKIPHFGAGFLHIKSKNSKQLRTIFSHLKNPGRLNNVPEMQIRRIWEFLGIRMTRTLQHSKQRKGRPQPANFQADQWTAFFVPPVHIGGYACFVSQSLDLHS